MGKMQPAKVADQMAGAFDKATQAKKGAPKMGKKPPPLNKGKPPPYKK